MNNLRKFATEADYQAAELNYPAVSWIVSGDTVKFDRTEQQLVRVAVKPNLGSDAQEEIILYNCGTESAITTYLSDITVDGVTVENWQTSCTTIVDNTGETAPLLYYTLAEGHQDTIDEWFSAFGTEYGQGDILLPAEITNILSLPDMIGDLVILATTPPNVEVSTSFAGDISGIYVPDEAVNTYKSAPFWENIASIIYPLSDYQGELPIN